MESSISINKSFLLQPSEKDKYETIQSELAKTLIKDKNSQSIIIQLLESSSYNLFEFGMKIVELNPKFGEKIIYNFIEKNTVLLNNPEEITPFFIIGIINALNNKKLLLLTIDNLLNHELYNLAFEITRMCKFTYKDFLKLVNISKLKNLPDRYFTTFNFKHLPIKDQQKVINFLWTKNEECKAKCIEITSLSLNNEEEWSILFPTIWRLLKRTNIFLLNLSSNLDYQINLIINKILDTEQNAAKIIALQLYEYCNKNRSDFPTAHYWHNVCGRLINEHYELMWDKYLGKIFLKDWQGEFFIVHMLSDRKLNIICNTQEKIKKMVFWCIKNKNAQIKIARNILLRVKMSHSDSIPNDNPSTPSQWNPAILALLKEFDNEAFLDAVLTNLYSYSLVGEKPSAYYYKCIKYLEELKGLFNDKIDGWILKTSRELKLFADKNKHDESEAATMIENS